MTKGPGTTQVGDLILLEQPSSLGGTLRQRLGALEPLLNDRHTVVGVDLLNIKPRCGEERQQCAQRKRHRMRGIA